jgi:hypothetical protein
MLLSLHGSARPKGCVQLWGACRVIFQNLRVHRNEGILSSKGRNRRPGQQNPECRSLAPFNPPNRDKATDKAGGNPDLGNS